MKMKYHFRRCCEKISVAICGNGLLACELRSAIRAAMLDSVHMVDTSDIKNKCVVPNSSILYNIQEEELKVRPEQEYGYYRKFEKRKR